MTTDPQIIDFRTVPPKITPAATGWQAWWEDHDIWDGFVLYADLDIAKQHAAVDYIGEEYGWVPGDDPADEAPDATLTWVFEHERWYLLDNGRSTLVQLYKAATYTSSAVAQSAPAETALRDRIAGALYERERPPRDAHWPDVYASDRETFEEMADAVLPVLPAPADRAAMLRDFLWRLEQSAGDAAAEKFLDDNEELRLLAAEERAGREAQARLDQPADELPAAPAALRLRVLREVIGRIENPGTEDSATEDVGAVQVLAALKEILADLGQPACPDPIECGHEAALGQAQQEIRRLGLMVDEYGHGASALNEKLRRVRETHRETCILAQSVVRPTAFTCGMCEVLDAPADPDAVSSVGQAAHTTRSAVLREAADIAEDVAVRLHREHDGGGATGAYEAMSELRRKANEAEYVATPCDSMVPCEDGGEPCHVHERLMAHGDGEHELCGPECQTTDGELRRMADETQPAEAEFPLSPDYQHPECGFSWHGRDGMDIPMRDGEPVCPRCEIELLREKHKASLRHADKINNELMEEVQRYAIGAERPVLWSVYNRMHSRAAHAEAALNRIGRIARRLAAHAVGFKDVLDDADHGPWGTTVGADIAELIEALSDQPTTRPAVGAQQPTEADPPAEECLCDPDRCHASCPYCPACNAVSQPGKEH